ncbi:MAG: porin [Burkholderiales bacterium]|jgi:predicted porin|nr:porin [Burkholderiales bacterium]
MKKKLVAIAVAGLLAAPLVQAQTANVTIYGRINMDLDFISSSQDSSLGKVQRVSSNASRIGFRGTESLGGGLNAIFQIESQFQGDGVYAAGGKPGLLGSRDTWLGLQGGWGAVKIGHMLTPYDAIQPIFGNAPNGGPVTILSTGGLWGQWNMSNANGGFGQRLENAVRYDSPKVAGFQGMLQYSTKEAASNNGWNGGLGLFYDNAGLQVAFAYETNQEYRAVDRNDNAYTLAAAYKFGAFRPAAVYEYLEYEVANGKLKRHMYGASLTMDLGPGKLYGALLFADKGKGAAGGAIGNIREGKDTGATMYNLSYTYDLSKRTSVYAGYVYIDNKDNATYTFGMNGHGTGVKPGLTQQGLILGAVHNF